ncbi:hypothetical protein OIM90_07835 [Streptomyces sp. AD16]|nr:hypothetical protein OIM90_07835 [Streptomyces sp. AD16]
MDGGAAGGDLDLPAPVPVVVQVGREDRPGGVLQRRGDGLRRGDVPRVGRGTLVVPPVVLVVLVVVAPVVAVVAVVAVVPVVLALRVPVVVLLVVLVVVPVRRGGGLLAGDEADAVGGEAVAGASSPELTATAAAPPPITATAVRAAMTALRFMAGSSRKAVVCGTDNTVAPGG